MPGKNGPRQQRRNEERLKATKPDRLNSVAITRESDPWIKHPDPEEGVISVAQACRLGIKVDVHGNANEARNDPLMQHGLLNGLCCVEETAYRCTPPFARERPAGERFSQTRSLAARHILDVVAGGTPVTLVQPSDLYLHSAGQLIVCMNPVVLDLTQTVHEELVARALKDNLDPSRVWTASAHKKHGKLLTKFPFCLRGGRGWRQPEDSKLWPVMASNGCCGFTGISQMSSLTCLWVQGGLSSPQPEMEDEEERVFWGVLESAGEGGAASTPHASVPDSLYAEEDESGPEEPPFSPRKSARLLGL